MDNIKLLIDEQKKTNMYLKLILEHFTEKSEIQRKEYPGKELILQFNSNINSDLFKRLIQVYSNEELERLKSNNKRKSARRVSVELGGTMCDFLNQHLIDHGVESSRLPDGLVVLTYNGKYVGAIKLITDMGFTRGEKWFEYAEGIVEHCEKKYDLENNQIYFIVSSLRNGVEQGYINKLINEEVRSNWEFLNNRKITDEFVDKYAELTISLAEPKKQIYFLASELHPNVIADDLHKMTEDQKRETYNQIESYNWINDLNELLEVIKKSL